MTGKTKAGERKSEWWMALTTEAKQAGNKNLPGLLRATDGNMGFFSLFSATA